MDSVKFEEFELRQVRLEDKDLLYRWANDTLARENAFNSEAIPPEAHERWFANTISSANRVQLVLEKSGTPIGQIRLDIQNGIGEIDYSIAPEFRGCGYGTIICKMLIEYSKKCLTINKIVAQVKTGNSASKRCFIKNGFESIYERFELNISEGE